MVKAKKFNKDFFSNKEDMEFIKKFKEKSTLTEEDAIMLGREVNRAISDRLRKNRQK